MYIVNRFLMLFAALHSKRLFPGKKKIVWEFIALETICVCQTTQLEILQLKEFTPDRCLKIF